MVPIGSYTLITREWFYLKGLEGLGGMALVEDVCHRVGLSDFNAQQGPVSLSLLSFRSGWSSQLLFCPTPACLLPCPHHDGHELTL